MCHGNIKHGLLVPCHKWFRDEGWAQRWLYFLSLFSRGRFGQVHKCVENSSGLTLAAKVIKARSQKEKVREPTIQCIHHGCWCSSDRRPQKQGAQILFWVHTSLGQGHWEQKQRWRVSPRWQIFDLEKKMYFPIAENSWNFSSCPRVRCVLTQSSMSLCLFSHSSICTCVSVGGGEEWDPGHE